LLFSQLLTLYITPVIYIYLDRVEQWITSGRGKTRRQPPAVNAPAE
jgi:HAE1 family hydrophobic/amphiphilic exporter-1